MCDAFMPTLENIASTLSAPKTGLVPRVVELEAFAKKSYDIVSKIKTSLVPRVDRMENTLNNGPTSVTQKLATWDPLIQKIEPIDNHLKVVEDYIPPDSLVTKVNQLSEKVTNLKQREPALKMGSTTATTIDNEEVRANKS